MHHREEHLADVFGLAFFGRHHFEAADFGQETAWFSLRLRGCLRGEERRGGWRRGTPSVEVKRMRKELIPIELLICRCGTECCNRLNTKGLGLKRDKSR